MRMLGASSRRYWFFSLIMLFAFGTRALNGFAVELQGSLTTNPSGLYSGRLIQFGGTLKDANGQLVTGVVGLTFAIYSEQEGGVPLWLESQNVSLDQGRYAVLLGATKNEGMPVSLFSSGESRWLGVQPQLKGSSEQPRVLLVSVPYA